MCLDRFRLASDRVLEGALRLGQIPFSQIQDAQREIDLGAIPELGSRCLQTTDRRVDVFRRRGGVTQESESIEILGVLAEDVGSLFSGFLALSSEEVDRSELEPSLEIVRGELLGLQEIPKCLGELAELRVRDAELPDRARICGVEAQDVPVLDHRLAILLFRGVPVAALEMTSLLSFRRTGAAG